jgi:hypothetical protein
MRELIEEAIDKILLYAMATWGVATYEEMPTKLEYFIEKTMLSKIESANDCDLYEIAKSLGFKLEEGD